MILKKYTRNNELYEFEPISETEWRPIRRTESNWAALYDVDLTGCNIRNRKKAWPGVACDVAEELSDINRWNSGEWAAALISPRHAVVCNHFWEDFPSQQTSLVFWGKSGTEYRPKFKQSHVIQSDRVIIEFEEPLPKDDVKIYKIADVRYIPEGSILWSHDSQGRIWFRRHANAEENPHQPDAEPTAYRHNIEIDPVAGDACIFAGDSGTPCLVNDPVTNETYLVGLSWGGGSYWDGAEVTKLILAMDDEIEMVYPMNSRADINRDGVVDGADLAELLESWGQYGYLTGDINLDGVVDGQDLSDLLGNWGDVEPNIKFHIHPDPDGNPGDDRDKPPKQVTPKFP